MNLSVILRSIDTEYTDPKITAEHASKTSIARN